MFSYGFFCIVPLTCTNNIHLVFLRPGGRQIAFVALIVAHVSLRLWGLGFDTLKEESCSVQMLEVQDMLPLQFLL